MPFEYDPRKSASNHAKHGIDFEQAQQLWDDEAYLEIPARNLMNRVLWLLERLRKSIGQR